VSSRGRNADYWIGLAAGSGAALNNAVRDNPPPCAAPEVDSEIFFSDIKGSVRGPGGKRERLSNTAQAKKICATCSITLECLEYALSFDSQGVWAGMTTQERSKLRPPGSPKGLR